MAIITQENQGDLLGSAPGVAAQQPVQQQPAPQVQPVQQQQPVQQLVPQQPVQQPVQQLVPQQQPVQQPVQQPYIHNPQVAQPEAMQPAPAQQQGLQVSATPMPVTGPGRGNEGVDVTTLNKPRLVQLQSLSPEVNADAAQFLPGAAVGDWINTVSRKNYGQDLLAINVLMRVTYNVWKLRSAGGGLVGVYNSQAEAEQVRLGQVPIEQFETVESHDHLLLIKDKTNGVLEEPIMLSMTKTKTSESRSWNTAIMNQGHPDRFAKLWKLTTVAQSNKQGLTYKGVSITPVEGWVAEGDFNVAVRVYEALSGNRAKEYNGA